MVQNNPLNKMDLLAQNTADSQKFEREKKLLKQRIELRKAEKDAYEAMEKSSPTMMVFSKALELMAPLEPVIKIFSDFFGIIGQAFEAGLGDSLQIIADTLFSPANVGILTDLGKVFGELIGAVMVPLSEVVSALLPLLKPLIPLIQLFADAVGFLLGLLKPAIDALSGMTNAFADWMEATF